VFYTPTHPPPAYFKKISEIFIRIDLVPMKPFKKNILMAQLRWHVAIATKSAVCGAV
jgi:hypothetical protein